MVKMVGESYYLECWEEEMLLPLGEGRLVVKAEASLLIRVGTIPCPVPSRPIPSRDGTGRDFQKPTGFSKSHRIFRILSEVLESLSRFFKKKSASKNVNNNQNYPYF